MIQRDHEKQYLSFVRVPGEKLLRKYLLWFFLPFCIVCKCLPLGCWKYKEMSSSLFSYFKSHLTATMGEYLSKSIQRWSKVSFSEGWAGERSRSEVARWAVTGWCVCYSVIPETLCIILTLSKFSWTTS